MHQLANGEAADAANDFADDAMRTVRGLATSRPGILPSGGFVSLTAYIHPTRLSSISPHTLNDAMEALAASLTRADIPKTLINITMAPEGLLAKPEMVLIHILEDQPMVNLLIVSTDDVGTHKKRTVIANPKEHEDGPAGWSTRVYAFGRLLGRMVEAHEKSGHRQCEQDGELMRAFYRHWYSGKFGHKPNFTLGGSNRPSVKRPSKEEK
jgi:hypothetical protein